MGRSQWPVLASTYVVNLTFSSWEGGLCNLVCTGIAGAELYTMRCHRYDSIASVQSRIAKEIPVAGNVRLEVVLPGGVLLSSIPPSAHIWSAFNEEQTSLSTEAQSC